MALPDLRTVSLALRPGERPRDEELDLFGLTHRGRVRKENQDHFLLATLHRQMVVHGTSLPDPGHLQRPSERIATIMLVADGVGGGVAGGEASRLAAETVTRYVNTAMDCFHTAGTAEEEDFYRALRAAALEAHDAVRAGSAARNVESEAERRGMATTLTLALAVWPWLYVVQVGDSRCYHYCGGELRQITRDQTIAQDLVDQGVLPAERAKASPFGSVLASAIGGGEAKPVVTRLDIRERGCVVFLCSDGLTAHVTDAEIAAALETMESSEQACRRLLDLALERGGTDNVTILAGRALRTRLSR